MYKTSLIFFVCLLYYTNAPAQSDCTCCTSHHAQFDFWLGEWEVFDTYGKKLGENKIIKLEKGCLISEQWQGSSGITGRSYNFFDAADSTWNQLWVDSQGNNLQLKGSASENQMILESKPSKNKAGQWIKNRITWTYNPDDTVTQLWELVDKSDKVQQVAFRGIYKKKSK